MPHSLWSHGLQHARLPCPSPPPRACSNSCPSSWWCHPTSAIHYPLPSPSPPALNLSQQQGLSNESVLRIRWPKYWNISPSKEYSGLIFFRMDRFDLFAVQETLEFSLSPHFKSINSSVFFQTYWKSNKNNGNNKNKGFLYFLSPSLPSFFRAGSILTLEVKWSCSVVSDSLQPHGL